MDNPGFQPDAEAALAHAHGQGLALPNNRRAPTADRRSLKNSRRQQQQQQQQRVFSVSCRALDVPPPIPPPAAPIHNNNAGEAKAAAAAATSDTSAAAWAREGAGAGAGACGLARLGCGRRRWELRPSQPPPPLLLGLLVAAAAALALVAVAAVLAASSVLDSPASPSPAVEVEPTTLVRGEFRLQPPPLHARPRSRPHHPPARGGSAAATGADDEAAEEEEEAAALSAAAVAALLSRVFRNFPRFAAAAATVQQAGDGTGAVAGAGEGAEAEGVVRCELTFRAPAGAALAPRVGLHFLGALRARAGRLWLLGRLPVDPRSVAFEEVGDGLFAAGDASQPYTAEAESSTEAAATTTTAAAAVAAAAPMTPPPEAAWGAWSAWGPCGAGGTQRRSRPCLAGARGAPLADSEPCLLLPGGGGDLEVRDCRRRDAAGVTVDALLGGVTRMQRLREAPAPPPTAPALAPAPADDSAPLAPPALALTLGPRRCDACLPGEVCVALAGETLPACRPPSDAADPTGCGGLCRLGRDLCHRLDRDAFRCVEDSPCLAEEWRCGNLLCIPRVKRCDGHLNCYDHTDEFDCECDLQTHFHCGNGTSCLPRSKRCDHIIDCWDGTDELNCTQACPRADQFTCSDGQCIPRVRFCDGLADCHDQSDEPFGCGGACKRHEWRCGNGRCVKKAAVCDGADDCGDETDEANCSPSRLRLRASQPLVNAK